MRIRHPTLYPETEKLLAYLAAQGFTHTGQLAYQRGEIGVWTKRQFYKIKFGADEFSYNNFENFFDDLVYYLEIRPTFDPSVLTAYSKYIDANGYTLPISTIATFSVSGSTLLKPSFVSLPISYGLCLVGNGTKFIWNTGSATPQDVIGFVISTNLSA